MSSQVRGEYDGMPGCFSAFPVTVILGVSGVSASDGGVMDLVRQMDEVLLVDEILLLDSRMPPSSSTTRRRWGT